MLILVLLFMVCVMCLVSLFSNIYSLWKDTRPYISKYAKKKGTLYINSNNEWDIK